MSPVLCYGLPPQCAYLYPKWAVLGGVGVTMYVTFYIDAHLFFPKWYSQSTE